MNRIKNVNVREKVEKVKVTPIERGLQKSHLNDTDIYLDTNKGSN